MADDASADHQAEPVGRMPEVPKPARDPVVIEGEATEAREPDAEPPPSEAAAVETEAQAKSIEPPHENGSGEPFVGESAPVDERAAPPPPPTPPRKAAAFGWGISGALIGAALALGAAWVYDPRANSLTDISARLATLEAAEASAAKAPALDALDKRVAGLEAAANKPDKFDALDKRIAALEGSAIKPEALAAVAATARAAQDAATKTLAAAPKPLPPDPRVGELIADARALGDRVAKLEATRPGPERAGEMSAPDPRVAKLLADATTLGDRVAKMEAALAAPPAVNEPPPDPRVARLVADATALGDRVAKLEAVQAAPKAKSRIPPEPPAPKDESASRAIAAIALEQRLRTGEPFAAEWAALARAGADATKLGALKPYADAGAPSAAALAASFAKVAPAVLAGPRPESGDGSTLDKLMDHVTKLVRVRAVGETPGETPDALVSQITAALGRGQVGAALAAFARLPESSRKAAGDWPDKAQAREAAESAARALREGAIAGLAASKN